MLALTKNLKMSLIGKNNTKLIWPGKQATNFISLTNKSYGTSGIAPTDLGSDLM